MTAPAIPAFPALDGLPVTQRHADQCARFEHATHTVDGVDSGVCPRCGEVTIEAPDDLDLLLPAVAPAASTAPAGLAPCRGNYVVTIADVTPGEYLTIECSGCADCDREIVRERMAREGKRPTGDPFARIPGASDADEAF